MMHVHVIKIITTYLNNYNFYQSTAVHALLDLPVSVCKTISNTPETSLLSVLLALLLTHSGLEIASRTAHLLTSTPAVKNNTIESYYNNLFV